MHKKKTYQSLTSYHIVFLRLAIFLFVWNGGVFAENIDLEKQRIKKSINETLSSVNLISLQKNEPLNFEFDFIDDSKRISISTYKKDYVLKGNDQATARIKQALDYEKKGNIQTFETILKEVILNHALSPLAARAALLLGNFENNIYNLDFAALYYIYIINVHYNSSFSSKAIYNLALLLEKKNNFNKAEELLLDMIKDKPNSIESGKAKEHLKRKYLQIAKWYWEKLKNYNVTKAYIFKVKKLYEVKGSTK